MAAKVSMTGAWCVPPHSCPGLGISGCEGHIVTEAGASRSLPTLHCPCPEVVVGVVGEGEEVGVEGEEGPQLGWRTRWELMTLMGRQERKESRVSQVNQESQGMQGSQVSLENPGKRESQGMLGNRGSQVNQGMVGSQVSLVSLVNQGSLGMMVSRVSRGSLVSQEMGVVSTLWSSRHSGCGC
jgi:hypothetical protein